MQSVVPEMLPPSPDSSPADLVREAMSEARELVRLEVELAKDEVKREVVAAKSAGIALVMGAGALMIGLSLMLMALALAIFPGPLPALVLGLVFAAAGTIALMTGVKLWPRKPMDETRRRLENDVETVKEHVS